MIDVTEATALDKLTTAVTMKSDRQVQAQTAVLVAQFNEFANEGGQLSIVTAEQYERSAYLLQLISNHQDYIKDRHKDVKAKAYSLHRSICDLEKNELTEPNRLESALKIARERYRRVDEERQRQQGEAIRRQLQQAAEQSVIDQAVESIAVGDTQQGLSLLESVSDGKVTPVTVAPPVIVHAPRSEGVGLRRLKRFRVTDSNQVKRKYLVPDMQLIQKIVTAMGTGAEQVVGGIEVYEKESENVR